MIYSLDTLSDFIDYKWDDYSLEEFIELKSDKVQCEYFYLPRNNFIWLLESYYLKKKLNCLLVQLRKKLNVYNIPARIAKRSDGHYVVYFYKKRYPACHLVEIGYGNHVCVIPKHILESLKN